MIFNTCLKCRTIRSLFFAILMGVTYFVTKNDLAIIAMMIMFAKTYFDALAWKKATNKK